MAICIRAMSIFYYNLKNIDITLTSILDENFSVPHNQRGIVGMANKGRHTNASQFYITLQPTPWMDTKYVAFG